MENEIDFRRDVNPNSLYELTALLGEGSYGAVYRGKSRGNSKNAEVAIKIIPDADDDLTALWREIRFLQVLRSPFVVSFIESLLYDNELWLVMELCDGGSLHDLKEAMKTTFNETQLKVLMAFSVLGLAHLHSQMSIHRDVKSGNILITKDGRAKLGDFGISAQLTDTIMKRRTVIGSPYWMAPEVIQETSYDSKADIWSLGITLLELCEGSPPHFNVHPMRAIFIISSRPAPTLKEPGLWSAEMADFVGRCLVKDCDQRASADELVHHPWIRKAVKEIGPKCNGSPVLQNLISQHWTEIERIRFSKFKMPDNLPEDVVAAAAAALNDLPHEGNISEDYTRTLDRGNSRSYTSEDNMRTMDRANSRGSNYEQYHDDLLAEDDKSMMTLRRNSFGLPATRQQVRNASLSRSTTPTATLRVRSINGLASLSIADSNEIGNDQNNKNTRVSRSAAGRLISADYKYSESNESLLDSKSNAPTPRLDAKRERFSSPPTPPASHSRPGGSQFHSSAGADYRRTDDLNDDPYDFERGGTLMAGSMVRIAPGTRDVSIPDDGGGTFVRAAPSRHQQSTVSDYTAADKDRGRSDVQAALRYFRDEPVAAKGTDDRRPAEPATAAEKGKAFSTAPSSSSVASPEKDRKEEDDRRQQKRSNKTSDASSVGSDALESDNVLRNMEYKKIIMKQLSTLKKQYRDDLEELSRVYEDRRKVLKDSLALFSVAAGAEQGDGAPNKDPKRVPKSY